MTQKELLYMEDAINHESSIIQICQEIITKLDVNEFVSYMEGEIAKHESIKENLMSVLKGEANG